MLGGPGGGGHPEADGGGGGGGAGTRGVGAPAAWEPGPWKWAGEAASPRGEIRVLWWGRWVLCKPWSL